MIPDVPQFEAYLLGILEPEEQKAIEELIATGYPEALARLGDAERLISSIALTAPEAEPSALLRSRVVNAIRAEESAATPAPAAESAPAVSILTPRRRSRLSWGTVTGWGATAAMLALSVALWSGYRNASQELATTRGELRRAQQELASTREVLDLIREPGGRYIRLINNGPNAPEFRAFYTPRGLVLTGSNVPAPATGRTMQLWIVPKSGAPISAGVFEPAANGSVIHVARSTADPSAAGALAISDEPAGGSPAPTTTPAWVGPVGD